MRRKWIREKIHGLGYKWRRPLVVTLVDGASLGAAKGGIVMLVLSDHTFTRCNSGVFLLFPPE